jgi:hypothetical protein
LPPAIWALAAHRQFDRVSSWSKLAAFAHPALFAIFDARTAAAMNCLYSFAGMPDRYFIPPSRNAMVRQVAPNLVHGAPHPWLNYEGYLADLAAGALHRDCSLLKFEMELFGNSEAICALWQQQP